MKKRMGILLAMMVTLTVSVTSFAADTTKVKLQVAPAYTVKIPENVKLEKKTTNGVVTYEKDMSVSTDPGVRLLKGKVIQVAFAAESDFVLKSVDSYTMPYTVTAEGSTAPIKSGGIVAEFGASEQEQKSILHFKADKPAYAGDYSDTVTFRISIADANGMP